MSRSISGVVLLDGVDGVVDRADEVGDEAVELVGETALDVLEGTGVREDAEREMVSVVVAGSCAVRALDVAVR
jgi:hypothetical protein